MVEGDQNALCAALPHCCGHDGGNLTQKGVRDHNTDGPHNNVGFAAGHHYSIFSGGGIVCTCLAHGGGGHAVGAYRGDHRLWNGLTDRCYQLPSDSTALGVNNQYVYAVTCLL